MHLYAYMIDCVLRCTVLSQSFVEDAVKLLVTRFIPLEPSDLEGWMTDPEEWVNLEERDNDLWEFELRVRTRSLSGHIH